MNVSLLKIVFVLLHLFLNYYELMKNEQTKRVKAPYLLLLTLEILRSPRALGDLISKSKIRPMNQLS